MRNWLELVARKKQMWGTGTGCKVPADVLEAEHKRNCKLVIKKKQFPRTKIEDPHKKKGGEGTAKGGTSQEFNSTPLDRSEEEGDNP